METKVLKAIGFSAGVIAVISVAALIIIAEKTYLETVKLKLDIKRLKIDLNIQQ